MKIVKAGFLYFSIVFGTGFILGTLRTLWVVPHFGRRVAELMEAPLMFTATYFAARWVVRRLGVPFAFARRLAMGSLALVLMLFMEFTVVLWFQGLSIRESLATRDPVSGTVYYVLLGAFAVMPVLIGRI